MTRPRLVQRTEYLLESARGKSVLHLGCTNHPYTESSLREGTLMHLLLGEVAHRIVGFDSDDEGLKRLGEYGCRDLHACDLENLESVSLDEQFEFVVAGEIIEHLSNPGRFLDGIKRFIAPSGRLLVTTVNAYCAMRFAQYALRGKGGPSEPVHPDHVAYYSFRTLQLTLERAGYVIEDFLFYDLGREHRKFSKVYYNVVNDVAVRLAPQLADGLIVSCRLRTASDG